LKFQFWNDFLLVWTLRLKFHKIRQLIELNSFHSPLKKSVYKSLLNAKENEWKISTELNEKSAKSMPIKKGAGRLISPSLWGKKENGWIQHISRITQLSLIDDLQNVENSSYLKILNCALKNLLALTRRLNEIMHCFHFDLLNKFDLMWSSLFAGLWKCYFWIAQWKLFYSSSMWLFFGQIEMVMRCDEWTEMIILLL